jgi:hypothetical protein
MKNLRFILLTGFALGFSTALLTVSGCSEAARRTLTIFQFQSTKTYNGQFRIDTSELPPDAIDKRTDVGKTGAPETRLELNQDYEFEVVLRLVKSEESTTPAPDSSPRPEDNTSSSL